MIVTFSVGSKCAVMLPREFINPQLTPATGLVVNKLIDTRSLILVEEIWQFKGLSESPLEEMCTSNGILRHNSWGWRSVPELVEEGEYLMLPAYAHNLMKPSVDSLKAMIRKSVRDFKRINGFE